jgi:hypothetical protein
VDRTGLRQCPLLDFGSSGVVPSGTAVTESWDKGRGFRFLVLNRLFVNHIQ